MCMSVLEYNMCMVEKMSCKNIKMERDQTRVHLQNNNYVNIISQEVHHKTLLNVA